MTTNINTQKDKNTESFLSSSISVEKYQTMEKEKDKSGIAKFINERFKERYISPFEDNKNKNGFIMMASACLMIEALESFRQGWKKSPNSALAFCQFFDRNPSFNSLNGYRQEFYTHVRCGIMHQGETTGGWHIRRDLKVIFDSTSKTIDATRFLKAMDTCLLDYCNSLKNEDLDGEVWKNFRKKMKDVCVNTKQKE